MLAYAELEGLETFDAVQRLLFCECRSTMTSDCCMFSLGDSLLLVRKRTTEKNVHCSFCLCACR